MTHSLAADRGTSPALRPHRPDWHSWAYRIVALLVAALYLFLFAGLASAIEAWLPTGDPGPPHRWHNVQYGVLSGLLLGGLLVLSLRRPRRTVAALQAYVLTGLVLLVAEVTVQGPDPELLLTFLITIGAPVVAFPALKDLLTTSAADRAGLIVLGVTALLASAEVATNLRRHLGDSGFEVTQGHWVGAVTLAFTIVSVSLVTVCGGSGRRGVGGLLAGAAMLLGASSVALSDQAGSWGAAGVAVVGLGVCWLWVVVRTGHADREPLR